MKKCFAPLALLFLLLLGSATATSYPFTVVDDLGREVTLDALPARVVSIVPSSTETVCAVGACDLLVGVDRHSNWPESVVALATLGDAFAPDLEAIVALEPDLVFVDQFSGAHEPLEALGITVYVGTPQTFDDVYSFVGLVGEMFSRESEAAVVAGSIDGVIRGVVEVLQDADRPTVFIELDPTPYSVGPDSFLGTVLSLAGGDNIVTAEMGDFPLVDPEYVVAQDPQVIVLTDAPFGVTAAEVAARPGWSGLAAVRDGQVIEVTQGLADMLSRPGPRLGEAVLGLARLLHPSSL